jgi:hypothetical protein
MTQTFDTNNKALSYADNLQNIILQLMSYPNVNAVYRRKKIINGQLTDIDCLVVCVSQKINIQDLDPADIIPSIVGDNIPTDIIESPVFQSNAKCYDMNTCIQDPQSSIRPLKAGVSFGVVGSCTLGAIVKDATDNSLVSLSNNHCIGTLYDPTFGEVYGGITTVTGQPAPRQPSTTDGGTESSIFGSVKRAVAYKLNTIRDINNNITPNLNENNLNQVDGSVCSIISSVSPDIGMLNIAENTPLDFVASEDIDSYIGQTVYKMSRTSCVASGVVLDTRGTFVSAQYDSLDSIVFNNQVVIEPLPSIPFLNSIVYANNTYFILGFYTTLSSNTPYQNWNTDYSIFTDPDNSEYININVLDSKKNTIKFQRIYYDGNKFVRIISRLSIVDDRFPNIDNLNLHTFIYNSTDCINWNPVFYTSNRYYGFINANDIYIAIGNGCYATSSNGIDWTETTNSTLPTHSNSGAAEKTIAYGNNKFVGIYSGDNAGSNPPGNGSVVVSSNNGNSWSAYSPWSGSIFRPGSICYGNNLFIITADRPSSILQTSTDGINWTQRTVPTGFWVSVAYGNGKFVALGSNAVQNNYDQIMWSTDGINWTSVPDVGLTDLWTNIEYVNNIFIAVSSSGAIMVSSDGLSWTRSRTPAEELRPFQVGGDSGSVTLTADNKILCLNHSAQTNASVPCLYSHPALCCASRIDDVADQLQIKPWQGEIVVDRSEEATITVNGRTYVKLGHTNDPVTHSAGE